MPSSKAFFLVLVAVITATGSRVTAKEGIEATVHTAIPADAPAGTRLDVQWTLAHKDTGDRFSALSVFIRLIGPRGDSSEVFAAQDIDAYGEFDASIEVPAGGVASVQIGIAGTASYPDGTSGRSDWLMALANDPIT